MSIKTIGVRTAVLAAMTAGSIFVGVAPSEAVSIKKGDSISIGNQTNSGVLFTRSGSNAVLDFVGSNAGAITATGGTGGFSSFIGSPGTIQDVNFINGVAGPLTSFFTINPNLRFDLTRATATELVGLLAFVEFDGEFKDAFDNVVGSGIFTTQLDTSTSNPDGTSFSFDVSAAPVPTPALLPGLIGVGVAALRKRKSEELESADV